MGRTGFGDLAEHSKTGEINPIGKVLVEIHFVSDIRKDELKRRTGLELPDPDNHHTFEGLPNRGWIRYIGSQCDLSDDLKIGTEVVFREDHPKAFLWQGMQLLALAPDQIMAWFPDGET